MLAALVQVVDGMTGTTWQIIDAAVTTGVAFAAGGVWVRLRAVERAMDRLMRRMNNAEL